jgi:hypothetical protein
MQPATFYLNGFLLQSGTGRALAGFRIEAWSNSPISDVPAASTVSDENGSFEMSMPGNTAGIPKPGSLPGNPVYFFRIYKDDVLLRSTENGLLYKAGDPGPLKIELDHSTQPSETQDPGTPRRVYGTVRSEYGDLLDGLTVEVYDCDLRNQELLGTAITRDGKYEVSYTRDRFRRAEKDWADILVRLLAEGRELQKSNIFYNSEAELQVNININNVVYQGPSAWEKLENSLLPLLEGVAPQDLRENDQFRDISFLAGETDNDQMQIVSWIVCYLLADKSRREDNPLEPVVFFGFIRQGLLGLPYESLLQDIQQPERVELLTDRLLSNLAEAGRDLQKQALESALSSNIIPRRIEANVDTILDTLASIQVKYTGDRVYGAGKGTITQLLGLIPSVKSTQNKFMTALAAHTGRVSGFWDKLAADGIMSTGLLADVKLVFELGAITSNHIPLVGVLSQKFKRKEIDSKRSLAKLDQDDWITILKNPGTDGQPVGVPANVDGATDDERYRQYASILERRFEKSYPTAALSAKLAKNTRSLVAGQNDVTRFLDNNPDFYLDADRIDTYVSENASALDGVEDKEATIGELKTIQRVFKLDPTYKTVDALLSKDIVSAQQVYFIGKQQFAAQMSDAGINEIDSNKIYNRAESVYALALSLFGTYNQAVNSLTPASIPNVVNEPSATGPSMLLAGAVSPDLQMLFGSQDYCECTQCRSVYSPAAYFVDILRFLNERMANGTVSNVGKRVKDVLFARRPDLGEIELSCENANTPLPYIDLVNEILENAVVTPTLIGLTASRESDLAPGTIKPSVQAEINSKGLPLSANAEVIAKDIRNLWTIRDSQNSYVVFISNGVLYLKKTWQTHRTAAELRANPEYINTEAYDKLASEVFPFNLPFNLWYVQSGLYLDHLAVPRPYLLETFQQKQINDTLTPSNLQLDAAWLGINENARKVIGGTITGKQPWDFWGLLASGNNIPNPESPANSSMNVYGTWIDVLGQVPVMLNRSGLNYRELLQVLDTKAVNPTGSVTVSDSLDTTSSCDVTQFRITGLTQDVLVRLHRFIRLWRQLGCTIWELDIVLPDLNPDPAIIDKTTTDTVLQSISRMNRIRNKFGWDWTMTIALYNNIDHTLYLDRSLPDQPLIQTLYQRLFRNKLVDAAASFPDNPTQLSGTIATKVPGLLAAFRITEQDLSDILASQSLTTASLLTWDNLSRIYRVSLLAKALQLSMDQFARMVRLSGQNPFTDPMATWNFIILADKVAASGFSITELDYLLAHQYTANSNVGIDDKAITTILQSFREGLQKVANDLLPKPEETQENYIKSKLGLLPALAKDSDQQKALSIINGTWVDTSTQNRNTLIDLYFTGVLNTTDARVKLAAPPTGLSGADRFAYVQPALQAYLAKSQKELFIRQKTAEVFQLELAAASLLLTLLQLPAAPTTSLLQNLNAPELLQKMPDGSYTYAIEPVRFGDMFKSLRLVHKNAMMMNKLNMRTDELNWWLSGTHAADMNWMHPKDLPVAVATTVAISKWVNISGFFAWKSELPLSNLTAFEFIDHVLIPSESDADNIKLLARLMAWNEADITALTQAFRWTVKTELKNPASLLRLAECQQVVQRLGVNAARALSWARAEPTADDAESLKQTVKARYDLAQWQQVVQPMHDSLREQKRDALVSWLVTRPSQQRAQNWSNEAGLYNYFLIDVEMSACMLTSRLKQAAASAQLFVQRCLMNIEYDVIARADIDSKWNQWKWMKYYRVWEANRKVFLYPENWIEPELRDEKSPFFRDLENELMQNDITNDTAEQAYLNYLEKLDKVANLEIRAMYDEHSTNGSEPALHVIGRTRGSQSPEHFYRKRINNGRWTAWERIDQEIKANHVAMGVLNRRLYLLWPQFQEKADQPTSIAIPAANSSITAQPTRYLETRLFCSELKKGKWTPKVLSSEMIRVNKIDNTQPMEENISFRVSGDTDLAISVFALPKFTDPYSYAPVESNYFLKSGKQMKALSSLPWQSFLISPINARYVNDLIRHDSSSYSFYFNTPALAAGYAGSHYMVGNYELMKNIRPYESFTVLDSRAWGFSFQGQFFFWDREHAYHADYNILRYSSGSSSTNRTVVEDCTFHFNVHYHPFTELFTREINNWGVKGLLNRRIQVTPQNVTGAPGLFSFGTYQPTDKVKPSYRLPNSTVPTFPVENVDFSYGAAYSIYNWELFFHAPFYIANKLAANQHFEEALNWFHYIFDPNNPDVTVANSDTPQQKYWITKPFYETTKADYYKQKIENLLAAIARNETDAVAQVKEWRDNPFSPHVIARMRTVAYQKNVLIKYIQTIIAWGDQLFRQNTTESINEATQLYVLADTVLGQRPKSIPRKVKATVNTYYQLEKQGLDVFGNALMQVENVLPSAYSTPASSGSPEMPRLTMPYFCIPNNDKLLTMWDTVADRLFKIRHCMNIEGVAQQLPLFDPPIDPGMLVKATAAGLDMGAVLADTNAPMPLYRFSFLLQRALELCNEVKMLGAAMLSALERKDAEAFAQLRASQEIILMDAIRAAKTKQVAEAQNMLDSLLAGKEVTKEQKDYYTRLVTDGWNAGEKMAFGLSTASTVLDAAVAGGYILAGGLKVVPGLNFGASGFGGSPHAVVSMGGEQLSGAAEMAVRTLQSIATAFDKGAALASTTAGYARRADEWAYQQRLAEKQLPQIDKQIAAADLRLQIAEKDLDNYDRQKENLLKEYDYMVSKFSNQELYSWMMNQLSTVYFQSYQLAYDMAKRVERCFRYELGLSDSSYIQFGYWDSLKKGLFSGEKLYYDLKRLEAAYYEQNRREYELTKHISLDQLDPVALMKLRQNGECIIDLPETLFDMDYPGHYFRRIKSVSLSIPCITGPYTTVACTLTLVSNKLRKNTALAGNKYERDLSIDDPRFRDDVAAIQSIATSSAQNDSGVFELNFRDERYLPFEGAGAISTWQIKLNKNFKQFNLATVSDVILHLNYTAREGGEVLKAAASDHFNTRLNALALSESRKGLYRVFDLKREFSTQWQQFLYPANAIDDQALVLDDLAARLPYFTQRFASKKVSKIELAVKVKDSSQAYQVMLSPLGTGTTSWVKLETVSSYEGLLSKLVDRTGSEVDLNSWTLKIKPATADNFRSLPADAIEALFLIINYSIA